MATKRVKVDIKLRVHPEKKAKFEEYCKENYDATIQATIENFIDNCLELSPEEIKKMKDSRFKADTI